MTAMELVEFIAGQYKEGEQSGDDVFAPTDPSDWQESLEHLIDMARRIARDHRLRRIGTPADLGCEVL